MAQAALAIEPSQNYSSRSSTVGSTRSKNARPVDLVHLSRQSLGDRELEVEILSLFKSQSSLYLDRLTSAKTKDERKMAAHTILGSARGIGAWQVAEEAEKIEINCAKAASLGRLTAAITEVQDYIGEILTA